jgi:ATP-dependent RNA helicase HelY
LRQQIAGVDRRIKLRTETLARRFDRVLAVLEELAYVEGWTLTDKGRRLTRLYGEGDLLVGEALAAGMFEGLRPGEVAALASTVVYEARERTPLPGTLPTPALADAYERLQRLWRQIRRAEDAHEVQLCRELEPGFAAPILAWAEGAALEDLLEETEMAPGDFVRNCKQLMDLLRQIEEVADPGVAAAIREARTAVSHGVVGYTGVSIR